MEADINRRPTWITPLLTVIAFGILLNFVIFRVEVNDSNIRQIAAAKQQWDVQRVHDRNRQLSVADELTAIENARKLWFLLPIYGSVISFVLLSAFFAAILWLIRAGTSFRKVFSVVSWSFIVYRVFGGVATLIAILLRGSANFEPAPPEAWSPTSLAHLVPRNAVSADAYSAISKLDVFLVWWLVVMAVGFTRTSRNLTFKVAVVLIFVCEAIYLTLNAIGALPGFS